MSFIAGAEKKINNWVSSKVGVQSGDARQAEVDQANADAIAARAAAAPTPTPAQSISVVSEQPTAALARPRTPDDQIARRRAAAGTGQSGVRLPPVGVRGAGASPRTSILGR